MRISVTVLIVFAVVVLAIFHFAPSHPSVQHALAEYAQFKREYDEKPFAEQHTAAHKMGAKLYAELGVDGFQVCDQSFAFGCYHAFFGGAIAEKGIGVVSQLAQSCRKRFGNNSTGCEHGIGHGLMEYLGHDHLVQALQLCDETKQMNPLYGCTSGVFMEYNNAISFPKGTVISQVRTPEKDLRAPCTTVPEKYRTSCYFEIGLWWKQVLNDDYSRAGNLCLQAQTQDERVACARGWGTVVAENVDYDPERALTLCDLIHTAALSQECAVGAASRFFGSGLHQSAGEKLCHLLPSGAESLCLSSTQ